MVRTGPSYMSSPPDVEGLLHRKPPVAFLMTQKIDIWYRQICLRTKAAGLLTLLEEDLWKISSMQVRNFTWP